MDVFGVVVIVVSVTAAVAAVVSYVRADRLYRAIGRSGGIWIAHEDEDRIPDDVTREELLRMLGMTAERSSRRERDN
jgi:hypothetical protein